MKTKYTLENVRIKDVKLPSFSLHRQGITQSMVMCYLKCRREFLLRINEWGIESNKMSFANGSITHDTLDKVYTYYQKNKKLPKYQTIRKWIQEYDSVNKNWLGPAHKKEVPLIKALTYVIVTEYVRFYKKDFEKHIVLGAEDIFDIIWKGFRLRGKKDLRLKIQDKVWILETKTSARIDEKDLVDKISFDFQSLFYTHAEEVEYKHEVAGVIYNVIRNPGHKLTGGETIFQFENRLRRAIRKDPNHFYKRWSIPYSRIEKMEFKQELLWKLQEIEMFLQGKVKVYRNEKNCVTRFRCSFLRACASGKLVGYTKTHPLFTELQTEVS
jgi:hypothetical protein